uniref:AlNc14C241G9459 protein n=1 Tax=Albugo laibachii Nc14 TaxID=890382 RepID=F0WSX0_9STRA|nr:AlNc14C241G9459 [Albugo laibachii Nc14]|eukprot:CCA24454.1 AlNc14C241G9459 [Albugo laibachii Nc14]
MNRQLERPENRLPSNNASQSEAKNKYNRDPSHRRTLRNTHKNLFSDGSARKLRSDTPSKGNFSILSRPVMADCGNIESLSNEERNDCKSPESPRIMRMKTYTNTSTNASDSKGIDDTSGVTSGNTPDRKKERLMGTYTPEKAFSSTSPDSTLKSRISPESIQSSSVNPNYKSPTPIVRLLKSSPIATCQSPSMPNSADKKLAFRFPKQSIRLVTAQLNIATDIYSCLGSCLGATDLMVIGILGLDGAGKSTIASILAGELAELGADQVTKAGTDTHDVERAGGSPKAVSEKSIFLEKNGTRGIDLFLSSGTSATPGNIIVLDTEAILSSHRLAEMSLTSKNSKSQDDTKHTSKAGSSQYQRISLKKIEANSIQQAIFLFSVCHYVISVYDDLSDFHTLKDFIYQVDLSLQQVHASNRLADCRLPGQNRLDDSSHVAELILVANRANANSIFEDLLHFDQLQCISIHSKHCSKSDEHTLTHRSSLLSLPELQSSRNLEIGQFRLDPLSEFERKAAHLRQYVQSLLINPSVKQSNTHADTNRVDTTSDGKPQERRHTVKQTGNEFLAQGMSLKEWLKVACRIHDCLRSSKDVRTQETKSKK